MMPVMVVCLLSLGILSFSDSAYAAKITSLNQAAQLALKTVKNADVTEMDSDYENGQLVYEIQLIKNKKEYDITYRASDGKMLSYSWEQYNVQAYSSKKTISKSKCRQLAQKEVSGASVLSLVQKYDDGILVYKMKMKKANKNYTLEYHAKTGKLIEYGWKLTAANTGSSQTSTTNTYIGLSQAKKIALAEAPKATVIKAEFDMDDGIPVYEIELIQGSTEYDIKIHAKTGKILEIDRDFNDDFDFD